MPELPDVENYKRYLDATALHKKIEAVVVGSYKVLRGTSGRQLRKSLRGRSFEGTHRHGKHLFALYADEILFQAKLHPAAPVQDLSRKELRKLYETMRRVLRVAITRGAGSEGLVERLPRNYLLPSREAGHSCPRCKGKIENIKVAGRTTYYCPRCQHER